MLFYLGTLGISFGGFSFHNFEVTATAATSRTLKKYKYNRPLRTYECIKKNSGGLHHKRGGLGTLFLCFFLGLETQLKGGKQEHLKQDKQTPTQTGGIQILACFSFRVSIKTFTVPTNENICNFFLF